MQPGGLTRVALQEGLARRELVARWRQQGHLGRSQRIRSRPDAEPRRRRHLLVRRYVERAENVARFIDVNLHLMLDTPTAAGQLGSRSS